MKHPSLLLASLILPLVAACGAEENGAGGRKSPSSPPADPAQDPDGEEEHEHAEDPLGTIEIGDLQVELAQGHGGVEAGEESHLVVKLPYSDSGSTIVRAWIGTEDRTLSYVGKGDYAPSHDDYDIHATAPDPLPEGALWWIEIEKPDGTKFLGSVKPLVD